MTLPVPFEMTGTVGQILTAAEWNSNVRDGINFLLKPPLFIGTQTTAQSIPNATYTPINFDTTTVDTYSGHSNTVNNSRYTAQVAGWYECLGSFGFSTATARTGGAWVCSNGSIATSNAIFSAASSNGFTGDALVGGAFLNVGDYLQLDAYQNSGAAANIGNVWAMIRWVHA